LKRKKKQTKTGTRGGGSRATGHSAAAPRTAAG
jgi:hypothetical protein